MEIIEDDLQEIGYRNILEYLSRTDSVIDFINTKVISLKINYLENMKLKNY
jgi:hypothetical protein